MLILKSSNRAIGASFSSLLGGLTAKQGFGTISIRYNFIEVRKFKRSQIEKAIFLKENSHAVSGNFKEFISQWKVSFLNSIFAPITTTKLLFKRESLDLVMLELNDKSLQLLAIDKNSPIKKFLKNPI
tara:strand:+ start:42 stop:425 length:384 start_codon:yes stop_codon:yes gene_type:complete